jgi:hypothetical protein
MGVRAAKARKPEWLRPDMQMNRKIRLSNRMDYSDKLRHLFAKHP